MVSLWWTPWRLITPSRLRRKFLVLGMLGVSVYFGWWSYLPMFSVMIVGLGGNNGSTVVAGAIANREKLTWRTKTGVQHANYFGSMLLSSTVRIGSNEKGEDVYVPFSSMLPTVH